MQICIYSIFICEYELQNLPSCVLEGEERPVERDMTLTRLARTPLQCVFSIPSRREVIIYTDRKVHVEVICIDNNYNAGRCLGLC